MSQISIRDIPDKVEAYIRKRAKKEGMSLSKVVNEMLAEASGLSGSGKKYRDLGPFCGSWTKGEAEAFNKSQEDFARIDEDAWK